MPRKLSPFWTLFVLTGLNLFNYIDRYVLNAVLPSLQQSLNLNDAEAGRLNTAFMLGYFLTSPIFGYLGDRSSRKWLIAAGIFVWSLGTILTGYGGTLAVMLAIRSLVGLGEASYATISPGWISDSYGPLKRNNALTVFYVAIPIGAAFGNILGGQIDLHWGWRNAFIVAGAPGLLLALILLPFREPKRGESEGDSANAEFAHTPKWTEIFNLFRIPAYVLTVLGYVAYTFALGAFGFWAPSFLQRIHHMPLETATRFFGIVLFATGLGGTMAGGLLATWWQKRNRAGYAWVLGLSVLAAIPTSFLAFLTENSTIAMTCIAIDALLLFLSTGPVNTLIIETVPVNMRAGAMALSIFTIHLFGDLWSPEIIGRASIAWGSLHAALLILPFVLIINAALWIALAVLMAKSQARQRSCA